MKTKKPYGALKRIIRKVAKEHGLRPEQFVHVPFEQVRRMPSGSVEHGIMDKYGELWGVVAPEAVH